MTGVQTCALPIYSLALPNGAAAAVTGRIVYDGPLIAPITKGQHVAQLEVDLAGQPRHTLPLVAMDAVTVAGPFDRIVNSLLELWR